MAKQLTCIGVDELKNPYERITHVGGEGFYITQKQAICDIEANPDAYYANIHGRSTCIVVAKGDRYSGKYIRAEIDNDEPYSLFQLPRCRLGTRLQKRSTQKHQAFRV